MDFYTDKKFIFLVVLMLAFLASIVIYPDLAGVLMILAVITFGAFSLMWKEAHIKMAGLILLVILALANIVYVHNMELKYGIDFVGGTRIPVVLEHSVDHNTMNELIRTIKTRISVLGLTEAKVRAIGDGQINVEIPSGNEERIAFIEQTISKQGVYQGIVDGRIAVNGDHIFSSTIRAISSNELVYHDADWGVAFSVDRDGGEQFASAAKGKADYPVYMFLDRPTDAIIIYERNELKEHILQDSGEKETLNALRDALTLEGGNDIEVYILDDISTNSTIIPKTNDTKVIISVNAPEQSKQLLESLNFTLVEFSDEEMAPNFYRSRTEVLILGKLEAVGLLSAPLLSPQITEGLPSYSYVVTGSIETKDPQLKAQEAVEKVKSIESVLKGGALPVQISLGSRTTLPASLGEEFLRLSLIAIALSLVAISVLIGLRYRNIRATLPIILISLAELTILLAILGSFTIDLPAMAGIIAAIGVGVDAQIVITDELLKKDDRRTSEKIELAFNIIRTNAIVAICSMIPLLFSELVEIIGFAMSTMLGALLGYMLTRPAYAAIVEKVLTEERKGEEKKKVNEINS